MYMRMNYFRGGYKKNERSLRNNDGSIITTNKNLAKKWGNYFDKLLNCEEPDEVFYFNQKIREEQGCGELTIEEIVADKYIKKQ